jgi:hypothetical protein
LREGHALGEVIDAVETRKIVMPIKMFVEDGTFENSIAAECELLQIRMRPLEVQLMAMTNRLGSIQSRL